MRSTSWREEWQALTARLAEHQATMLLGIVYLFVLGPFAVARRLGTVLRPRAASTWVMRSDVGDLSTELRRPY